MIRLIVHGKLMSFWLFWGRCWSWSWGRGRSWSWCRTHAYLLNIHVDDGCFYCNFWCFCCRLWLSWFWLSWFWLGWLRLFFFLLGVSQSFVPVILLLVPLPIELLLFFIAAMVMAGPLDLEIVRVLNIVVRLLVRVMDFKHLLWTVPMVPVQAVCRTVVLVPRLLCFVVVLTRATLLLQVRLDMSVVV